MTIGIGNLVALICIIISIIFAVITPMPFGGALRAIFAVLWWDARAPWGRP